jgi:hypothetical protein
MFIRGKILIFEGPDGVGKTTLRHWPSEQFYSYIRSNGPSYNPGFLYNRLKERNAKYIWCIPEDTARVKENHRLNKTLRHEEYDNIDSVIDDYYFSWFGKCKRNVFIKNLSPLRERKDFIRYDLFKDGYKLDEFTDKVLNAI